MVAPFGFTPTGKSYCVLHAKQAAGNAKIEAFRSWIVSVAQRSRLDVPHREGKRAAARYADDEDFARAEDGFQSLYR